MKQKLSMDDLKKVSGGYFVGDDDDKELINTVMSSVSDETKKTVNDMMSDYNGTKYDVNNILDELTK